MSRKRPLRNSIEQVTEDVPRGPLGFVGEGNLVGASSYFAVALANGLVPVDGIDIGFDIESHSVKSREDGFEVHEFVIHSASRDTARFIARFKSSPSNIQALATDTTVTTIEEEKSNRTFSRWFVRVEVRERGREEEEEGYI